MPPKGKGGKGKGKSQGVVIDGVKTSEMTREQLEIFALRLKEELEREREERNFFQLERDKLRSYWEITRNELEEKVAELRMNNAEFQSIGEKHDDEIKMYRQTIKNLRYDQLLDLAHFRIEKMTELRQEAAKNAQQIDALEADKLDLKYSLINKEDDCTARMHKLKADQQNMVSTARDKFIEKVERRDVIYNEKLEELEEKLNFQYTVTHRQLEDRFHEHLANMEATNTETLAQYKVFFNHIIQNNIGVIDLLKEQISKLSVEHKRMKVKLEETLIENHALMEPLQRAQTEARHLKAFLKHCERDFHNLQKAQKHWVDMKTQYEKLILDRIARKAQYEKLVDLNTKIRKQFHTSVLNMKVHTNLKSTLMEEKLKVLNEGLNQKAKCERNLLKTIRDQHICIGPLCVPSCISFAKEKMPWVTGMLHLDRSSITSSNTSFCTGSFATCK